MSEPPSNWNEIRGDKVFWDLVMAFKQSDEVWSKVEIDDEDDGSQHALALDFVKSEGGPNTGSGRTFGLLNRNSPK